MKMANEFKAAEQGHIVPFLYPISMNGIATEPEYVNMKGYSHLDIIIVLGATNGAAVTFTVKYSATSSGGTAMPFAYYKEITASTDILGARTAATTAGFAASNDSVTNTFYVISIDAAEIPDGYNFIGLVASGAVTTTPGCAVGILSGARYAEPESATVLS
jgi:hypothetical protein